MLSYLSQLRIGHLARHLWRLAQSPTDRPLTTWTDVPTSLRRAAGWVQALGIMRGYPDGTFRPGDAVTRGSLAVYLWRAMQRPTEGVTTHAFPDVPAAFAPAVDWAVTAGIMAPYPGGTFGTDRVVTRALGARSLYALALHITDLLAEAAGADPATSTSTTVSRPTTSTTAPSAPSVPVPPVTAPSAATTLPPAPASTTTAPAG